MKIRITLKDPDGFYESVREAVEKSLEALTDLGADEKESLFEHRVEKVWEQLEPWVEYQEYVTLEFDTEKGTAEVVKKRE